LVKYRSFLAVGKICSAHVENENCVHSVSLKSSNEEAKARHNINMDLAEVVSKNVD
jgi:hypothetical protein